MVISFKAQAQSPLEGQSLNQGARNTGCTRLWQARTALAGCNPSSWKSAGYLRHKGGRWRGRPQDSHLSPGLLSLFKSIPGLWGGGRANQIRPTHLHGGRFFDLCRLYTPASAGPAVTEHQLYGKRRITSSDPPQLGLCRNSGLCSPFICVCHLPQILNEGLVGGYKFTQASH